MGQEGQQERLQATVMISVRGRGDRGHGVRGPGDRPNIYPLNAKTIMFQ